MPGPGPSKPPHTLFQEVRPTFSSAEVAKDLALPMSPPASCSPSVQIPPTRLTAKLAKPRAARNNGPIQAPGWESDLIKALAADLGAEVLFLMEKPCLKEHDKSYSTIDIANYLIICFYLTK